MFSENICPENEARVVCVMKLWLCAGLYRVFYFRFDWQLNTASLTADTLRFSRGKSNAFGMTSPAVSRV